MKNLVKSILVLTIAFGSLSINASNFAANIEVSKVENKLIKLTLEGLEDGVTILLKDEYGEVIYDEKVKNNQYSKNFSLENLLDGDYLLEFRGKTVIKKTAIQIKNSIVAINDAKEVVIFRPTVNLNGDLLVVNKLAATTNEAFNISLYDEESNLLYTERIEGSKNLGRKFNIALLQEGRYDVVMESKGEYFRETIIKK